MMHLLITRPKSDGKTLQAQLNALGIATTLAPTLDVVFEDLGDLNLEGVQAIVITSRNALKSLAHNSLISDLASLPIYTVGEATAEFAKSLGLTRVIAGPGTAKALADDLIARLERNGGPIHHLRGANVAFDLKSALKPHGFQFFETIVYRAEPVSQLTEAGQSALRDSSVNGVILMSVRSARAFVGLVKHHGFTDNAQHLNYFCLSPAIHDYLQTSFPNLPSRSIFVSDRPNTEELLALIGRFAANYRQT